MTKTAKTPMMEQWEAMKEANPDTILFFRMGDFYEMFGEDAVVSAEILGLTLTTRSKKQEGAMPMAGIPHHALDRYLKEMIKAGIRVAICDQLEDPATAKGIVKRGVTRVVTPGTLIEESCLEGDNNNYLASVAVRGGTAGIGCVDISTGEFFVSLVAVENVGDELEQIGVAETLVPVELMQEGKALAGVLAARNVGLVTKRDGYEFSEREGRIRIKEHFGVDNLAGLGIEEEPEAIAAVGAILVYLAETQKVVLSHVRALKRLNREDYLVLDRTTQRNLELTNTLLSEGSGTSLFKVIDRTCTGAGRRLLKNWLLRPLLDLSYIEYRQMAVRELLQDSSLREELREVLAGISDLERIMARITTGRAGGRELIHLYRSLCCLPKLQELGEAFTAQALVDLAMLVDPLPDLVELIGKAIVDEPPLNLREGGVIRSEYDPRLAELRSVATGGKDWIRNFQQQQQEQSGITSLKVGFNKVFGYYIEVTNTHKHKVPQSYIRKQTLANAERYITQELKEYEELVLGAQEKILALELELFVQVRATVAQEVARVQQVAQVLAEFDAVQSLAQLADLQHYIIPEIGVGIETEIVGGRHPVLDLSLSEFTPNDCCFSKDKSLVHIITGPNMAGKSTFIRQVALLGIMAQMGGGIPAEKARIGIIDRVFTRVGAADDLAKGQSTFMVEMAETANILNNATSRSLIVLDEVGRGTSTFDGVSLAWAITEYIHNRLQARTLFATHYHELSELGMILTQAENFNVAVRDWAGEVIFLHKIVPGAADKSYGIHVARLAGIPLGVIERSREILDGLETQAIERDWDIVHEGEVLRAAAREVQSELFAPQAKANDRLVAELAGVDIDNMTPLMGLQKLQQLVDIAREYIK